VEVYKKQINKSEVILRMVVLGQPVYMWLYLVTSAILLFIGFAVSAEQIALLAGPDSTAERIDNVLNGALILKSMLVADGVILLIAGIGKSRSPAVASDVHYTPLWSPSRQQSALWGGPVLYWPAVIVLLTVATVLRVVSLDNDLWIDEVFTLVNFVRLPMGQIITDYSSDNQHMLFSVLARIGIITFGESVWAIRLPSVIFGIASIWAAMRLATLVYGSRVAVYTGLLLTLSYHNIWFSQNARGYTLLLFGTVLSTCLLLRGLQSGKWRYWTAYALVIALSTWAHMTAVFVAIAHGFVIAVVLLKQSGLDNGRWRALAALVLAAWFTLHLYALVLPQVLEFFTRPGAGTGVVPTEWRSPLWLFNETFRSMGIGIAFGWIGITVVSVLSVLCLYWFAKRDWVFIMLAILPGLLLGLTMYTLGRNLWPRMFFNESGFLIILIVVAAIVFGDFLNRVLSNGKSRLIASAPAILVALVFVVSLPGLYRYPKQDFTGARDFVLEHMEAGDRVLGLRIAGRVYNKYYAREWPVVENVQELNQYRSKDGNTWVLYTFPRYFNADRPELARALDLDYEIVRIFPGTLGDGNIIVAKSNQQQAKEPDL